MKKRILSTVIAVIFILALITGCSQKQESKVLKIGATPVPHAEILEIVKELLAKENITLEIVEYTDYVQPNLALDSGDLDANFFQHMPYLVVFNEENGTDIISGAAIHFEPLGLYAGKSKQITELPDGGVIAVPNDTSNEARALLLLEAAGLITLPENSGLDVTPRDIIENPKNLTFQEIEAALIPSILQDVDLGVINGNYALGAGLSAQDMLTAEGVESAAAETFANIVAIRPGDNSRPEIQALIKAITSQEVADFISEKYVGSVVAVF